jgi:hypothetical protein
MKMLRCLLPFDIPIRKFCDLAGEVLRTVGIAWPTDLKETVLAFEGDYNTDDRVETRWASGEVRIDLHESVNHDLHMMESQDRRADVRISGLPGNSCITAYARANGSRVAVFEVEGTLSELLVEAFATVVTNTFGNVVPNDWLLVPEEWRARTKTTKPGDLVLSGYILGGTRWGFAAYEHGHFATELSLSYSGDVVVAITIGPVPLTIEETVIDYMRVSDAPPTLEEIALALLGAPLATEAEAEITPPSEATSWQGIRRRFRLGPWTLLDRNVARKSSGGMREFTRTIQHEHGGPWAVFIDGKIEGGWEKMTIRILGAADERDAVVQRFLAFRGPDGRPSGTLVARLHQRAEPVAGS